MIEIKILCPPINLYSKPWQHAFDKRGDMKEDIHARLRIYWERTGKPQLEFKHGDDPWVEVAGNPTWHPSFRYRIKGMHAEDIVEMPKGDGQYERGYHHGYAQALADMKRLILKCENNT